MSCTPVALSRRVNDPRATDLLLGAAVSAVVFATLFSTSITVNALLTAQRTSSTMGWLLVLMLIVFVAALVTSIVIALFVGFPLGALLAWSIRRTDDWRIHLAAFAILGGTTGALVFPFISLATLSDTADNPAWLFGMSAIGAVSSAAGWAFSWSVSRAETGHEHSGPPKTDEVVGER